MKKLAFILIFLFSVPAFGQSVKDTNVRIRDNTDSTMLADVQAYAATLAGTVRGVVCMSVTFFVDTTTSVPQIWQGAAFDDDAIPNTTIMPYTASFLMGWDADNSLGRRFNLLDSFADGKATSANSLWVAAGMYGYNGATMDLLRVGASNELQVTDVATRPGEDAANDQRKVSKVDTGTSSPAKTTTTGIEATPTVVLASTEILDLPNVCIYLENDDDADPFTDAAVYVSPDGSTWIDLGWSSCDTLAFGEACVYCISGNAYRYLKAEVTGAAGNDVDVDAWYTGNKD